MFRVYNTSDCNVMCISCAIQSVKMRTLCIQLVNCKEIGTTTTTVTTSTTNPMQPQSSSAIAITIGIIVSFMCIGFIFVVIKKNCCKQVRIPEQIILMSEINVKLNKIYN